MEMNLHTIRKLSTEISVVLNTQYPVESNGNITISIFSMHPRKDFSDKISQMTETDDKRLSLMEIRKILRDFVSSVNKRMGIDDKISEKKYLTDLLGFYNGKIYKGSEFMPENVYEYFLAKKEAYTNSNGSLRENITIPCRTKEMNDQINAKIKSLKRDLITVDAKIMELNANTSVELAEILNEEQIRCLEEQGLI